MGLRLRRPSKDRAEYVDKVMYMHKNKLHGNCLRRVCPNCGCSEKSPIIVYEKAVATEVPRWKCKRCGMLITTGMAVVVTSYGGSYLELWYDDTYPSYEEILERMLREKASIGCVPNK